jgi:uncharacterized protein (DUF608 family)
MKTAAILSLLPLALALPGQKRSVGSAPILKPRDVEALLENKYIVKMKDDVSQASIDHVNDLFEGEAYQKWDADQQFKGLAAQISAEALEAIAELEDVSESDLKSAPFENTLADSDIFPALGRVH